MKLLLLRLLFRKMWNNRGMTMSTLIGIIVAVAFTASIPLYTSGALKRLVSDTLRQYDKGTPPGSLLIRYQATGNAKTDAKQLQVVSDYITKELPEEIGYPTKSAVRISKLAGSRLTVIDENAVDPNVRRQMSVTTMSDFKNNIRVARGKYPSEKPIGNTIEVIVHDDVPFANAFRIGDSFSYALGKMGSKMTVRVVGTFVPRDESSPYWAQGLDVFSNTMFVPEPLFYDHVLKKRNAVLQTVDWYAEYDLVTFERADLSGIIDLLTRLDIVLFQLLEGTKVSLSFVSLLEQFRSESIRLQLLLFMLAAPVLAMVYYYLFMNAKQSLVRQQSDIAVLRSRGAKTAQISWLFLLEGGMMGAVALIVGTITGWFMALSIGATSEFLTFVQRKSLSITFSWDVLLYALIAVLFAIGSSVIPAMMYARTSIVGLKRMQARADRPPIWKKFYVDFILLGAVAYGYYLMQERLLVGQQTGLAADTLAVQPALFFVPAVAIFALGLFLLRLFPLLLRAIQWVGGTWMPLSLFITFTQLSRSSKSYHPIMLLLILTLGLGMYNAAAARTMDQNARERVLYQYGSTVRIQTEWESRVVLPSKPVETKRKPTQGAPGTPAPGGGGNAPSRPSNVIYTEPPFEVYRKLPGVAHAARVLEERGNMTYAGKSIGQGMIMGIDNTDFAKVAWWRRDLYTYHPYQYLNQLGLFEQAILVSKSIADKHKIKPGDPLTASIKNKVIEFIVVGVLTYWPSQYAERMPFYIANLDYLFDQMPLTPYKVWLKLEDDAKLLPVIEQLKKNKFQIATVEDVRTELLNLRNKPSRGGVFGILSLAFIVSILVSLFGYVMYWFFQLTSRVVQFGVLRAMGLTRRELTTMLLIEQLLTAGLSIAAGIVFGRVASHLFLPFLQSIDTATEAVPPFRIVFATEDSVRLYAVVAFMMLLGGGVLLTHIRKLRVHQAIKLGEER